MDFRKERTAEVFDFGRRIKKVRVVAWLDEKEAGGKAVSREKDRLGLGCEEKLPGPFKVILFQKNLWKTRSCVLCDFDSFEAARKEGRLENFLHPETETDDGVQCNFCLKFQCRICLEQLHELGLGQQHPDFGYLKAYLSKPQPQSRHPVTVESCSCCSLKNKIVKCIPMVKSTCFKKEYHQQWDGMLWFPEYGLVVPSCLGRAFDTHSLAQFSPKEAGVLHGLVSPEMAVHLEDAGIKSTGKTEAMACSTLTVMVDCEELERKVQVKVKLCVYARCNIYTDKSLGSDITEVEARQSTCVLTNKEMKEAQKEGLDIICLVGKPSDEKLGDQFLLVGRVLPTSKLLGKVDFNRNALFKALKDKLPRNGYESRRFGGSSGKCRYDQHLLNFLSNGGTTCRQGIGTILEMHQDGRNWNFIYKSGYSQAFKSVQYSPPVLGGQVDPKRIEWSKNTCGFKDLYASTKTLLPHVFDAVNKKAGPTFAFAKTAIVDELTIIKAAFKEAKERKIDFKDIIVEKHTMTLLLAAVRLHRDKAHKSVKRGDQDYSFLEYKIVFEVSSETGRLLKFKSPFARMRGGAGRRRAAVAIATHKSK
jgi:hypothetical protein